MSIINYFENATFNYSWDIPIQIRLFDQEFDIIASADAYYSTDVVTQEQNDSFKAFISDCNRILNDVEQSLIKEAGSVKIAQKRFEPKKIKIKKNGDYAFLFDDKDDFENGLVVSIRPVLEVLGTDEYL